MEEVHIRSWDGGVTVELPTHIEGYDSADIRKLLFERISSDRIKSVIFDFSNVRRIDSMGIGLFLNLQYSLAELTRFRFCNMADNIRELFAMMKLVGHFEIDATEQQSRAKLLAGVV